MNVFVSHSNSTDRLAAKCLYKAFKAAGMVPYDHDFLSDRLNAFYAGGPDLEDLVTAYRQGGRPGPTQEKSDATLHRILVDDIAQQDAIVIFWSEQYGQKFWTRRELKIALSLGVPIVVIMMEASPLDRELEKGVAGRRIPLLHFGQGFDSQQVLSAVCGLKRLPPPVPLRVLDEGLNRHFLRLEHPSLGPFEIGESYFTWADMKRFCGQEPPVGAKPMDIGGNVSHDYIAQFCEFISQQSPFYRYRLPTEIEWEFSARAGNSESRDWLPQSPVDREGAQAIRNEWGLWFAPEATEWTSTATEWWEYNGWVRPIEVKDGKLGPDRAYVVKLVNDGPGAGHHQPWLMHAEAKESRLGFRLVRESRKDINLDQVLPLRYRDLARELLLITDPDEMRSTIRQMVEYGTISRYFRAYLEYCALERPLIGPTDLAEPLLVQILMTSYVPPVTLPPYLQEFYRQHLRIVFAAADPKSALTQLLDKLEAFGLFGREFAEVLLYYFREEASFEPLWQTCLERLGETDKELVFRFCSQSL